MTEPAEKRMVLMEAPITTIHQGYVVDKRGSILVEHADVPEVKEKLRAATKEDLLNYLKTNRPIVYIEIGKDEIKYPYGKVDFVEYAPTKFRRRLGFGFTPRFFVQAAMVLTPKMTLIE